MLHKLLMSCRSIERHATDFDEGAMTWRDRVRFRLHLVICRTCARYLKQLEATKHACRGLKAECRVSAESKAKILQAFRAKNKSC